MINSKTDRLFKFKACEASGLLVLFFLLFFLVMGRVAQAQQYEPTWESLDKRPIPEWFKDAKFGIFIHWGVYSVPAYRPVSNKMYETYAEWYEADVIPKLEQRRNRSET